MIGIIRLYDARYSELTLLEIKLKKKKNYTAEMQRQEVKSSTLTHSKSRVF